MRTERRVAMLVVTAVTLLGLGLAGCAQNTETPVRTQARQETVTPTRTQQEQAAQGSQVNTYIINAPGKSNAPPGQGGVIITTDGIRTLVDRVKSATTAPSGAATDETETSDARYLQAGISVSISTGNTTPGITGTTTGTGSGAQTASPVVTASPVQRIRPEITLAVPIALGGPGSIMDQQATATGRGTTSGTDKTSTNDLRWAQLKTQQDYANAAIEMIARFLGLDVSTVAVPAPSVSVPSTQASP